MKKLLIIVPLLAIFLVPLYPIYAETNTNGGTSTSTSSGRKTPRDRFLDTKQRIASNVGEFKEERKEVITNFRTNQRELVASKTAALKAALARFRNKQKATTVERINNLLASLNEKATNRMEKHLDKLLKILSKLETRVEGAEGDKTAANAAIADAKEAIDAAKAALTEQVQNDYTIEVTSEAKVKENAVEARSNLHADLKEVHNKIVDARKAVADAIRTASSSLGGQNGE